MEDILEETCHDCEIEVGKIHDYGCDVEECPFCHGQLASCDCIYDMLGLRNYEKYGTEFEGLSKKVYEEGLTAEQNEKFLEMLKKKGRIPYKS